MFKVMVELQHKFNEQTIENYLDKNLNWNSAIIAESGELLGSLGYKWWKKQTLDMENVKVEAIDLLHFVISESMQYYFKHTTFYIIKAIEDFKNYFEICQEKLSGYDAVIATGNNLSASKFEQYFNDYPNIIRKSRHSVAIVKGNESNDQLEKLSDDIFSYFGLGCRNVSKVFLPKNYDLDLLFKSFMKWKKSY